ncbi:MAG: hypothetical protein ACM3PX_02745 [Omnitrophica WOR_2 bacterium]
MFATNSFKPHKTFAYILFILFIVSIVKPASCQGLITNTQNSTSDSLTDELKIPSNHGSFNPDSLQKINRSFLLTISRLNDSIKTLIKQYAQSENRIKLLTSELEEKNRNLEEQLRIQREKETLFMEKEKLYQEAINSTMLDKVKLEGQIAARDSKLDGKEREISLLQQNISDKDKDIVSRNGEIMKVVSDKERADFTIDTLRRALSNKEILLIKTGEQLKYSELKVKDCESRYITVTNKKKKTRVVQGFAIKNYRTPDFILAPKDVNNPSVYVINNRNSSNVEFDYVTGATFMIKDLTKEGSSLTYDLGFFLGFGGNNLFKNFYIGPNIKLFDVVHLNAGANIAEYEVLKDGFKVGDVLIPGTAIPTNKAWKINGYVGFTFDLELITMIGKR